MLFLNLNMTVIPTLLCISNVNEYLFHFEIMDDPKWNVDNNDNNDNHEDDKNKDNNFIFDVLKNICFRRGVVLVLLSAHLHRLSDLPYSECFWM